MSRNSNLIAQIAVFCASTAILIWLIARIANEGPLTLNFKTVRGETRFGATAVLLLTTISASFGYVIISELRDRPHERRLKKKIHKDRHG